MNIRTLLLVSMSIDTKAAIQSNPIQSITDLSSECDVESYEKKLHCRRNLQ